MEACFIERVDKCKSATSPSLFPFIYSTLYASAFTSNAEKSELSRRKIDNKALLKIALCTHKKYDVWFTTAAPSFSFPRLLLSLNAMCWMKFERTDASLAKKWKNERIYRQSMFDVYLIPNCNFQWKRRYSKFIGFIQTMENFAEISDFYKSYLTISNRKWFFIKF